MGDLDSILRAHDFDTSSLTLLSEAPDAFYILELPAKDIYTRRSQLQTCLHPLGYTPVILGADEVDLRLHRSALEFNAGFGPVQNILDEAAALDPTAWFEQEWKKFWTYDPEEVHIHGAWPEDPRPSSMSTLSIPLTSRSTHWIGLIPILESWQIPAYMRYGRWNSCPIPSEHTAIHRYWQARYDAELIIATGDTIQCLVKRPPRTREEAIALAREQFAYCSDIVRQGVGTLEVLSAKLLNGSAWYFWWD